MPRLAATRRLVIFDCDGTLVDSQHMIVRAMQSAFADGRHAVPRPAAVRRVVGLSPPEAVARLAPGLIDASRRDIVTRFKAHFDALRRHERMAEALFPGTAEMLADLAAAEYTLGVATGKSLAGLERTLDHHGLRSCFATLQTADRHPSKPNPAMAAAAMAEVDALPGETALVGDTTYDMEMALNAGIPAVGVSWGYHRPDELAAAGAHTVVEAAADLPAVLGTLMVQPAIEDTGT